MFGKTNAFVPVILVAFFTDLNGISWGIVIIAVVPIEQLSTILKPISFG